MRPRVAVTTGTNRKGQIRPYANAVREAGGEPVFVGPGRPGRVSSCRGLLLTGGLDVHPASYRRQEDNALADETQIECYHIKIDIARDDVEFGAIKYALTNAIPILGICRGIQILNIALGGSLLPDIPSCFETDIVHRNPHSSAMHDVEINQSALLHELLQQDRILVNSYHHQGLTEKELAVELDATAWSKDGLIEAVEAKNRQILAVQWHPERTKDKQVCNLCKPLFRWLIDVCAHG